MLQKHFYWLKLRRQVSKYIRSYTACAITKPTTKKQGLYTPLPIPDRPWESISMDYMSGLPSTKWGNDYVLWFLIAFIRWKLWLPTRRESQQRPLPSSSLNKSRYILESHKPLSQIGIVDFSAHSDRASNHYWTPSSPNPQPSTPRQMAKLRL
jgi:hypothetical protein